MRDKRPVDELSIEDLERILAIRKREARLARAGRYAGRRVAVPEAPGAGVPVSSPAPEAEVPLEKTVEIPDESAAPAASLDQEPRFEDEFEPRSRLRDDRPPRVIWWNRALLGVEVAAVLGLVILFVTLFASLQDVTRTTAQMQADFQATSQALVVPPTATPIINIASVVLPEGHIYDAASDTARFNLDEVPAQYRAAYQQQVLDIEPAALPTESPQGPLYIRIPAIGVESVVVSGDNWTVLQRGVGHHLGSANPGERGNMVLSAHNDVYGEIFRYLEKLKPGDQIYVKTQLHEFVYVVQGSEIVEPTDVRVLDNSRRDVAQVTLITCHPYRVDTHRYVVYGVLQPS